MDYLALNFSLNKLIKSSLFKNMQDTMKTPTNFKHYLRPPVMARQGNGNPL